MTIHIRQYFTAMRMALFKMFYIIFRMLLSHKYACGERQNWLTTVHLTLAVT